MVAILGRAKLFCSQKKFNRGNLSFIPAFNFSFFFSFRTLIENKAFSFLPIYLPCQKVLKFLSWGWQFSKKWESKRVNGRKFKTIKLSWNSLVILSKLCGPASYHRFIYGYITLTNCTPGIPELSTRQQHIVHKSIFLINKWFLHLFDHAQHKLLT